MNRVRGESAQIGEPIRLEGFTETDLYQRREKIFTRYVGGFFQRLRFYSGWPLLLGYFLTPWIQWGDRQAVLFDLPARQFHLFGLSMWPQDLWLLGWLLIIGAFGLFTLTTLVGRLWCGYTCPQTIWTAIFMWAEQVAEGSRHQRIRLDKAPISLEKAAKRSFKHAMWIGWAVFTGITFVGYFSPIRELVVGLVQWQTDGWVAFWVFFFSAATYVNAGWLREQVCIYMCPYARFQSAMFDQDTMIVSYDATRGEPRGARKRGIKPHATQHTPALGDCIDCRLCVQVCPTGIDIRDGLQYECIGCAHCIDACSEVMKKMNYAPGLIRYSTEREQAGGTTHWLRGRSIGYGLACAAVASAFLVALFSRVPFEMDILRERGELFRQADDGQVYNDYQLKVMNKSQREGTYALSLAGETSLDLITPMRISVAAGVVENLDLRLSADKGLTQANVPVMLRLCEVETGRCVKEQTRFLGPAS